MAYPLIYNWTPSSTQAISQIQTLSEAGDLLINGSLASGGTAVFPGYARTVSLTADNDTSAVSFTILGTINGVDVSYTMSGPNTTTVESTGFIFDSVYQISSNAPVTNISVGIGTTGRTAWFLHSFNTMCPEVGIQVIVTDTINYTFVTTLTDIQNTLESNIPLFTPLTDMTGATTNLIDDYMRPSRYSAIQINSSNNTGALNAIFLQQGLI
jgi:hypothetical protein